MTDSLVRRVEVTTSRGPCAKRSVQCEILVLDGRTFVGRNDCANPQKTCPRGPGDGYGKCQSICDQAGHAEVEAVRALLASGAETAGSRAFLTGHYWICESCGNALREAGVVTVEIDLLSAP